MKNSKLWILVLLVYLTPIIINNKISCDESNEPILTSSSVNISNPNYIEQISCEERKCHKLELTDFNLNEIQDRVFELMGKEAGKIFIEVQENSKTISDEKNELWLKYLREIANRKGRVIFEPIYIQTRDMSLNDIPLYGGYFKLGSSIYERLNSILFYGRMEHYNTKVLFHPKTHHIMAYFFVHKNYGSICKTIFSNCNSIQYIDDDVFDFQLEEALSKTKENFFIVEFTNTEANLPFFRMEIEALLEVNKSSRLYKWLVASKVSEAKPIVQERFLSLPIAIKIIDYSLSAYDLVQSIRMYSSARTWKTTTYFEESAKGKSIKFVHFERIAE